FPQSGSDDGLRARPDEKEHRLTNGTLGRVAGYEASPFRCRQECLCATQYKRIGTLPYVLGALAVIASCRRHHLGQRLCMLAFERLERRNKVSAALCFSPEMSNDPPRNTKCKCRRGQGTSSAGRVFHDLF